MKERPILFSAPMVRAILEGRKTMTRRICKPQPQVNTVSGWSIHESDLTGKWFRTMSGIVYPLFPCPYGITGDHLWLKETFSRCACDACLKAWPKQGPHGVTYVATYSGPSGIVVRPSIFMPRWASRITLEITNVKVEHLQDISEEDARKEGVSAWMQTDDFPGLSYSDPHPGARGVFSKLWESIYGEDSWDLNPWVWAILFRRL